MFYGWRVVAGVLVSQLFVGGFFTYAASLLVAPVREEFGVSLEQVMYALTLSTLLGLVLTPVAGIMIDRYPVRWLMTVGAAIFSAGLWGIAQSQSISQYILLFGLTMSLVNALVGSMATGAVVSRWFTVTRGRALGVAALGTSIGGIIVPAMVSRWLGEYGWRGSLEQLSFWVLVLMLPVIILTVRGKPSDVGLAPETQDNTAAPAMDALPMSLKDILRTPAYWYLGLSLGILFSAYSSMLSNLTPYTINLGHSAERASALIMTIAASGFVGKLLFGAAADKFSLKVALGAAHTLVVLGFLILSLEPGYSLLLVACSAMGLAAGGMIPVWAAMVARIFGLLSYGRAMGLMGPLLTLCMMPSYTLVGRLYDTSGSFTLGLQVYCAALSVGILLLIPLRLDATETHPG